MVWLGASFECHGLDLLFGNAESCFNMVLIYILAILFVTEAIFLSH
jgi:hypothetical protein